LEKEIKEMSMMRSFISYEEMSLRKDLSRKLLLTFKNLTFWA
jgi:hypothetical protein